MDEERHNIAERRQLCNVARNPVMTIIRSNFSNAYVQESYKTHLTRKEKYLMVDLISD